MRTVTKFVLIGSLYAILPQKYRKGLFRNAATSMGLGNLFSRFFGSGSTGSIGTRIASDLT